MPRKTIYWTRKLELQLVEFVRQREFIWKPLGNTNHHIQQKYKAYAEFAANLGRGFTARSVRDRWVNIRSTFNHNVRRVDKSKETAASPADVYVPCWPLWKPLQFLRDVSVREDSGVVTYEPNSGPEVSEMPLKQEIQFEEDKELLTIRQRGQRTDRPRRKMKFHPNIKDIDCQKVLDDLRIAMRPLITNTNNDNEDQSYWFFGKHITERLNCMRTEDAECASRDILALLENWPTNDT
ncbi:uncharacterized protein LOC115442427 [Manduca sexta]|uniref:MADF domain-containing protein n=1 Tax=Manduca sexta TaxID=7130 RepID=A0A921Z038_MANSE|nr:uncharacterized protein LOC115442427 [Manduca sexta]KAG6448522.1 hypothetical protein O3G_MSEX005525 [Manduca sexta]KAG6448523.1 hypothetical protein O3G_MSEX005525 [Manduca sexta]